MVITAMLSKDADSGVATHTILVNMPPQAGALSLKPSGDKYVLSLPKAADLHQPVSYQFAYEVDEKTYLLSLRQFSPELTTRLPNEKLTLKVFVRDGHGSETVAETSSFPGAVGGLDVEELLVQMHQDAWEFYPESGLKFLVSVNHLLRFV